MHKACTQRELQKRKANETKNSPTDGEEVNPKPETNQTAPHRRSLEVYLMQFLCSQKSGCFIPAKLSTSSKKESNSTLLTTTSSQTNSTSQIINPKLDSGAPKPSQTSGTPNSTTTELPHNEWTDDPRIHHQIYTYNTTRPAQNPFSLNYRRWESYPKQLSTWRRQPS